MATKKSTTNTARRGTARNIEEIEAEASAAARSRIGLFQYTENSPFERIATRLNGVEAIANVASINHMQEHRATDQVMGDLWFLVSLLQEDIHRDLYELDGEHYEVRKRIMEENDNG